MRWLWMIFIAIFMFSFAVLGWVGSEIYRQRPPIPHEVVTTDGQTMVAGGEVSDGQNVWQAMGGMQVGSVWGHGSYVAPDWTADYLHREALYILDIWAKAESAQSYLALGSEQQAMLRQRLQDTLRKNTYDAQTGRITIEPIRARAFEENLKYYSDIFTNGNLGFAIQRNAQSDPVRLRQLTAFFFWTSWAAVTNRPNQTISYTSNFPSEPLVNNVPTSGTIVWTGVSVIMLLAGIGAMIWFLAGRNQAPAQTVPEKDPLIGAHALAEGYDQVLPGGHAALSLSDPGGRAHGALRSRRRRLIWHPAGRLSTLRRDAVLAHTAEHSLDCDGLAGIRTVHRPDHLRVRTEGAEARRGCAVRRAPRSGARFTGRAVVERRSQTVGRGVLLFRTSRLRIC
jgi:hypothetical protein